MFMAYTRNVIIITLRLNWENFAFLTSSLPRFSTVSFYLRNLFIIWCKNCRNSLWASWTRSAGLSHHHPQTRWNDWTYQKKYSLNRNRMKWLWLLLRLWKRLISIMLFNSSVFYYMAVMVDVWGGRRGLEGHPQRRSRKPTDCRRILMKWMGYFFFSV